MCKGIVVLLIILLATGAFPLRISAVIEHPPQTPARVSQKPIDLTNASDTKLQQHLGEIVSMRGKFSLRGKVGPFILHHGRPIYLESQGSSSWGKHYGRLEGKEVRVTGTLRFAHYPERGPESASTDKIAARAEDHFYFEAETAKVKLSRRKGNR